MNYNYVFLDYVNDDGKIKSDLKTAVENMNDVEGFDSNIFYEKLNNLLKNLVNKNSFQIIKLFPTIKPYYLFAVLYFILKDLDTNLSFEDDFNYLKKFIDYEIDLFVIVNYLRIKED